MIAYQQGKIFRKFKTDNKFISAVSAFKISKATINFKIGIVEFIDKYLKMQKSCIPLYYLENNFMIIKEVCQENAKKKVKKKELFWFTVKQRCDFRLFIVN